MGGKILPLILPGFRRCARLKGEAAAAETRPSPADSLPAGPPPAALQPAAGTPDLLFVKNDGRADARAAYFALGKALYFTRDGVRLAFRYAGEGGANRAWGLGIDFWGASRQAPAKAAN